MTTLATVIGRGALASRPAAGTPGALWYDTTNSQMTRDNGTSWDVCEPAAGLSNPMTAAGQMIAGGASGAPVAVAAPTASAQVMSAVNGAPFLSAPSAPSLATATTGGTVAAGVYQAELTLVNTQGETVASASASITTTGSTSTITVTSPAAAGSGTQAATGWYAYVTQVGGSTYTRQQTAGSPTAIGTNLVISAPPTSSGLNPPGSNTAGTLIPGWATAAGGTSGALTKISETILGSAAASISFTSIPGTYRHLMLTIVGRGDNASTDIYLPLQFNGDTAANYDYEFDVEGVYGENIGGTFLVAGKLAGASAPTSVAGAATVTIYDYARTSWYKIASTISAWAQSNATGGQQIEQAGGKWRSTAAITQVTVTTSAGNFLTNTVATLYGIS